MSRRKQDPIARAFDAWLLLDASGRQLFQAMIAGHERTVIPKPPRSHKRKALPSTTPATSGNIAIAKQGDIN